MERLSGRIWLRRSQRRGFRGKGGGLRCGLEGPRRRGGRGRRWEGEVRRFGGGFRFKRRAVRRVRLARPVGGGQGHGWKYRIAGLGFEGEAGCGWFNGINWRCCAPLRRRGRVDVGRLGWRCVALLGWGPGPWLRRDPCLRSIRRCR